MFSKTDAIVSDDPARTQKMRKTFSSINNGAGREKICMKLLLLKYVRQHEAYLEEHGEYNEKFNRVLKDGTLFGIYRNECGVG